MKWTPSVVKELARSVEFEIITVEPSPHSYRAEWFREFRQLSKIKLDTLNQFVDEVGTRESDTPIDASTFNSWFKSGSGNRFPGQKHDYLDTWYALISGVCEDEQLAKKWLEAFERAKSLPRSPSPTSSKGVEDNQEQENQKQESMLSLGRSATYSKKYLFIGGGILLLFGMVIFLVSKDIDKSPEFKEPFETTKEVDTKEVIKPSSPEINGTQTDTSYKSSFVRLPGLLNQIYLIGNEYKTPPKKPTGDIVGVSSEEKVQHFDFSQISPSSNIANMINNKSVGSYYSGQIEIEYSGSYLFSLDYKAGRHLVNQWGRECRITLGIGENLIDRAVPIGLGEEVNLYYTMELNSGYQDFSLWIGCEDIRGNSAEQHLRALLGSSVLLSIKSPKDTQPIKASPHLFSRLEQVQ